MMALEHRVGDEIVMAYADGELTPAERDEVERAAAEDPDVAARIEMFRRTRTDAKAALDGLALSPLPQALLDQIRTQIDTADTGQARAEPEVVPFAPARRRQSWGGRRTVWRAAAAIVLVAFGVAVGVSLPGARPDLEVTASLLDDADLGRALPTLPSGETIGIGAKQIRAVSTFRDGDDRLCREMEVASGASSVVAVACRTAERWRVDMAIAQAATDDLYVPASSLETLDAYLSAIGATAPLEPAEERQALAGTEP